MCLPDTVADRRSLQSDRYSKDAVVSMVLVLVIRIVAIVVVLAIVAIVMVRDGDIAMRSMVMLIVIDGDGDRSCCDVVDGDGGGD